MDSLLRRLRAPALLLAAVAVFAAPPASAAEPPPCPPGEVADLTVDGVFVAGRGDGFFEPHNHHTDATANPIPASFVYTVPAPAAVVVGDGGDGGVPPVRLDAPVPGPVPITATWEQGPKSPRIEPGGVCRATDTFVVPVVPMRVPVVRREAAEHPVAIGPTLTWPCPDETRTTDRPGTFVVRYERGLERAPDASSPAVRLELPTPCDISAEPDAQARGVLSVGIAGFRRERSRKALAIFPVRAGDLRIAVEIRWGDALAFRHDYAVVSAGRRVEADGRRTPVYSTTEPGAAAAAVVRRYARERRGLAYSSPEQRAANRSLRRYALSVRGSFATDWTGGLGTAGEPGCGFVRETGTDRATFSVSAFAPDVGGALRGRIDRNHVATRPCPLQRKESSSVCPQQGSLGGTASAAVIPAGGLLLDGRRARGTRVTLGLFAELPGRFCIGWGGLLPSVTLDAAATGVLSLRVGGRTTIRLARVVECADAILYSRGDVSACTVRVAAKLVVRRIR